MDMVNEALKRKAEASLNKETVSANLDTAIAQNPQTVPEMDSVFDSAMEEVKFALFTMIEGFNMLKDRIDALEAMTTPPETLPVEAPAEVPTEIIPPTGV